MQDEGTMARSFMKKGRTWHGTSKSYMWIYLSGSDGLPGIVLYDYRPGRGGENPIEFLSGFKGLLHCDGYSAYGRIEDVDSGMLPGTLPQEVL